MKYNQKLMDKLADNLEQYLYIIENYVIIEGLTKEEYDESVKDTKKLIKKLRKGKGDNVFEKYRYIELKESGRLNDE